MEDQSVLQRTLNGDKEPAALPFALLEYITDNFSEERKIGQGGYGKVYKGVHNGKAIALKLFYHDPAFDNKHFENECVNLLRIRHPNIVRLVGYCYETQHKHVEYDGVLRFSQYIYRILCFEYLQGGSLDKYLKESRDHDWPTRYNIIKGTCEGLNFLHGRSGSPVLHLDLKPANILLDKNMGAKVADFGLSRFFSKTHITNTTTGTEDYMPPEFWSKKQISTKNDVYSLGVIILEIMAGRRGYSKFREMDDVTPFIEEVITNWREWINATTLSFPSAELHQVKTCIEIAIKCVDHERNNRPTVAEILRNLQDAEIRFLEESMNHAEFLGGQSLPTHTKSEPRGGSGGTARDIKEDSSWGGSAATHFRFRADKGSSIMGFHSRFGGHHFSCHVNMYPSNNSTLSTPVTLKGNRQKVVHRRAEQQKYFDENLSDEPDESEQKYCEELVEWSQPTANDHDAGPSSWWDIANSSLRESADSSDSSEDDYE